MQGCIKLSIVGIAAFTCSALFAQPSTGDTIAVASSTKNTGKSQVVTGVIKDAATGKPLPAVNVSVPNYAAALTDDNGKFSIRVPDYNTTLYVTGEGFQMKEIALRGNGTVETSLYEESYNSIYDNVTVPFGVKSRNQTTNAIGSVNADGNWNRTLEPVEGYLQGKVAGLQPIMRSGTPNVGAFLALRGYNSLYGTNQPLVVVDGHIFDINDYGPSLISNHYTNAFASIDVKDIENITVIKDAVSTYGTKAANGVILITTSHAKQLATRIDAAVYGGGNFRPAKLPVMEASDYRVYLSDILKSRGWTDDKIQAQPYMNDNPANPDYYRYHNNTDWQSHVLKNSESRNIFLKVTGGDNIAKYSISIGYSKNAGVTEKTDMTKYGVRFNGDINLSRRLTANTNLSYTYYEQNLQDQGLAYKTNPIYLALIKAPFLNTNDVSNNGAVSPNLADTDTLGLSNPLAAVSNIRNNSKAYRFFGGINFRYQLSQSVSIFSLIGVTVDEVREQTFIPGKGIADDTLGNAIAIRRLGGQGKRLFTIFNDTYVDYSKTFNRIHKLQARAGVRYLQTKTEQSVTLGFNSPTDNFISVGTGVSILRKTGGDIGKYKWLNTYVGADYSLYNKYFLALNMAVDGSSRFGAEAKDGIRIGATQPERGPKTGGNAYAVMPSVGASWLVSSEHFMSQVKFVDLLKLRASIGKTGNDDIGNYTSKQGYVSQNLLGLQGLVRANIGNPGIQWESNTKANVGVDVALLKERISLSWDYFQNKTSKMIAYEPAPTASGFTYAITNSGAMKTTGMDFGINARVLNNKDWKLDLGATISYYKNRITELPGDFTITSYGGATVRSAVNNPANIFWGYKTNGVYATDADAAAAGLTKLQTDGSYAAYKGGDVRFVDLNGDKIINDNDRQNIGNPNPDYVGGFNGHLSWKRFAFDAVFTFSKGNQSYNGVRAALEAQSSTNNQLQSVINRWRVPGQITNVPKASYGDPMGNSSFSDRWIEDGSFLRLKVVSLSYDLPLKKGFVKNASVYTTANNLLTFTKYLGFDPEFQATESILSRGIDVGLEPQFKSFTAGLRIGL
jgi:TonB-linked SusC/RagA family outer membrane protein